MPTALGYAHLREAGVDSNNDSGGWIDITEYGSKVILSFNLVVKF